MIYIFEVIFSTKILSFQAFYIHGSWQILQDTLKSFITAKELSTRQTSILRFHHVTEILSFLIERKLKFLPSSLTYR